MKKMSRALVMLCLSFGVACGGADGSGADGANVEVGESETTAQSEQTLLFGSIPYRGVNLASAEFAANTDGTGALPGVHGADYVYPDPAYAAGYNSATYFVGKKMNTFRLPFRWERLQPNRLQAFASAELARLRTTVNNLRAKGAVVLLDPHNYARYGTQVICAGIPNSHFADFWKRLADEFKNDTNVLFGLMNEPYDLPTEQWVGAANAAIAAIRETGAKNLILVPGNAWTGSHSWMQSWYGTPNGQALLQIKDPGNNYGFEVHQYLDADFSGASDQCPSTTAGAQAMQEFTNWLKAHGKKGFLGEFSSGSSSACQTALDNLIQHMEQNADVYLGWTYWAAGPWWGGGRSLEPNGSTDKPEMDVLERHLTGTTTAPPGSGGGSTGGGGGTGGGGTSGGSTGGGTSCAATYEAEAMNASEGGAEGDAWNLWTWGYLSTRHSFNAGGATVTVRAKGTPAGGVWPSMTVTVGGKVIGQVNVNGTTYRDYVFSLSASAGEKEILVTFDNDANTATEDRNLIIDKVSVRCTQAPTCSARTLQAERMAHSIGRAIVNGWNLTTKGHVAANYNFSAQPTVIKVIARGVPAAGAWPRMTVRVAGKVIGAVTVASRAWKTYSFKLLPSAGAQQIRISFDNDVGARSLMLDKVVIGCP